MKMKEILTQKVATQNLDRQLQKLAADLTLNYLVDSFDDLYSAIYNQLKKVAGENPKTSKKKKLLALLAGIGGAGAASFAIPPIVDYILPSVSSWSGSEHITLEYKPKFTWPSVENYVPLGGFETTSPDIRRVNKQLADRIMDALSKIQIGKAEGSNVYHPIGETDLSSLSE